MRLWIFCVLTFCASSSLARGVIHEYYDEMYEEPFYTEDEGETKVDIEHLDNVDKDDGKSKEDLENTENGHDTINDYQFEDNRSSESNDKQNIVEVPTEPMNSLASDIESEHNDDDEEDSENDGSETDPPADDKNIEDNDNGNDGNPENYSSEAEKVNENAKEPADFRADSEDNDNGNDGNPENYSSEAEKVNENAKEPADFRADSEDTEYRENQKSHNSDASEIVEQQTEQMNSPSSYIESKDNYDGEEDSENDGSETDSIVEESYDFAPPADGKDNEVKDNGYDGNSENNSSEAKNVNENAKTGADFRSDSEDIEDEDTEYTENLKRFFSIANEILEQATEPMNSQAFDIEIEDNDDDEEESEIYGSETDDIVKESNEIFDSSGDGEDIKDKYSGYEENLENDDSKVNSKEEESEDPEDSPFDENNGNTVQEENQENEENLENDDSKVNSKEEESEDPEDSPVDEDIRNTVQEENEENLENDDSKVNSKEEESKDPEDSPVDEDNRNTGQEENQENDDFEGDDIVKESNELFDASGDGEDIKDKYSGYEEKLENDDSKVNSKEEEAEDPEDSPVDEDNRNTGQEENQENDDFEGKNIVEDPLILKNDEDVEDNTSDYEENFDYNIDNSVDKPKKPVDSPNDNDELKNKDTDEENQESYYSEAYDNVEEPTELEDSLANDENTEDSDALVNKVNSKMFEGYNYNDFGTLNEEFYKNTNDSAIDQNINYDESSAFKPLTDTSISEEINGTVFNLGEATASPRTISTITEENEDTEPSPTEHSDYVNGINFGSSDIKTIKDDGNENTTDSNNNMAEKTSHQNAILPKLQISTRVDYYSSEAPPFSSSGVGQNIVPGPLGVTYSSHDDLSDDSHHKNAAQYSTDSTNAEENEDYESSDVTSPVFEALTDGRPYFIDSPNFSPNSLPAVVEYFINAQGSGIELNIISFSVNKDSGAYLLVKPGGMHASDDDAIVLSYQQSQERMYRFMDVDCLYMKFFSGDPPRLGTWSPSNSFQLSVRMLNGQDPRSYYEQPSLTVALGGSTPTAFDMDDEKKEDFRRLITGMAEQYIADGHIIQDTDDTSKVEEPWTNITEVNSCTNDVRDGLNCVKVTFTITYGNYHLLSFNLTDLMRVWYTYQEEYASRFETMGLKVNWGAEIAAEKQKQHRLVVWLVTGAGVLISAAMLGVALWTLICFKGYKRMPAHGDTESLTKKQPFPALYSEQRLTWDDDKATKVDLDGYANMGFAQKLLDMDSDDDVKTTPCDRKTISPSDVYQV